MIADKDRSGYIGASDTDYVMRSWNTKSFADWWRVKQGLTTNDLNTKAMMAGTAYEHKILDALGLPNLEKDKQIIIGRLRVNLDGNTPDCIYEVKTHSAEKVFKAPVGYRRQVNVQMWASGIKRAKIVSYALTEAEYNNWYLPIDPKRIALHDIEYDEKFIAKWLPRMKYLEHCLIKGLWPREEMVE